MAEPLINPSAVTASDGSVFKNFSEKAALYHGRVPYLRNLPLRAVAAILTIASVNIIVWVAIAVVLRYHPALISNAVLAYTLGLRHALDADHITAIDLMTRRLVASGQKPVTVGMFFSLGHSTIVVITSIVVAGATAAVSTRFDRFSRIGSIIGSSISSAFLITLGLMNVYILVKLIRHLRHCIHNRTPAPSDNPDTNNFTLHGAGPLLTLLQTLFRLIDRPWKMYPLGVLFGLGFDTSSEIALLGLAAVQAARGTSIWLILIFPLLFTAGMCLLDTTDGALMMALYTSASLGQDRLAIAYYSIALTAVTVLVAVVIGMLQLLTLISNALGPERATGPFWDGVAAAGEHYDVIGGAICAAFVLAGVLSFLLYKPWRRRVDRKRRLLGLDVPLPADEDDGCEAAAPAAAVGVLEGQRRAWEAGEEGEEMLPVPPGKGQEPGVNKGIGEASAKTRENAPEPFEATNVDIRQS